MPGLAIRGPDAEEAASLYERHGRAVYNVCYRILGYEEGAARAAREALLDVLRGADAFAAAHTACHRLIEGPSVLREARRPGIRVANLTLSVDEREALALRELEGLAHGEIAEVMGTDREAVLELVCGARTRLAESLRGYARGPRRFRRADCERALPLMALELDGSLDLEANEGGWLGEHLMRCRTCRLGRDAMQEATDAYRAWRPMEPSPKLFRETMTAAAEAAGADWSKAIARHERRREAIHLHRLRDLTSIGVLACLVVLVALAGAILRDGRDESGGPPGGPAAAEDAAAGRAAEQRGAAGGAREPASRQRGKAPRTAAKRGAGSERIRSERAPGGRRRGERRAAESRIAERLAAERRSSERRIAERRAAERRAAERRASDRRSSDRPRSGPHPRRRGGAPAPETALPRQDAHRRAEIERGSDRSGQERLSPTPPAPTPTPSPLPQH